MIMIYHPFHIKFRQEKTGLNAPMVILKTFSRSKYGVSIFKNITKAAMDVKIVAQDNSSRGINMHPAGIISIQINAEALSKVQIRSKA